MKLMFRVLEHKFRVTKYKFHDTKHNFSPEIYKITSYLGYDYFSKKRHYFSKKRYHFSKKTLLLLWNKKFITSLLDQLLGILLRIAWALHGGSQSLRGLLE